MKVFSETTDVILELKSEDCLHCGNLKPSVLDHSFPMQIIGIA